MVKPYTLLRRAFELTALGNDLTQNQTNGASELGTDAAPELPAYLTDNPLPNGRPWSTLNEYTNYYKEHPNTGVIRRHDFHIRRGKIAPDGYEVDGILVNGAYPGPPIYANWGDTIMVTVHNHLEDEGFAMHWHGFLMKDTPWEDGVPAVTQCPIPPGKSYTYTFTAEMYGSSWYHSHYSAQYGAGVTGPIVIYGPWYEKIRYDIDLGPVMLSDWYHQEYFDIIKTIMTPNAAGFVSSDTNLINGKNNFDCATVAAGDTTPCKSNAGLSKFTFKRGKVHRLRLINSGAEGLQRFSIDGHTMQVIANDFVPIEPYDTKVVTLGIGQRTDVLVKADGKLDGYWMRSNISVGACGIAINPNAVAAIYYDRKGERKPITSTPWDIPDTGECGNDDLAKTKPVARIPLPKADLTYNFIIDSFRNSTGHLLWKLGNVSFRGNYNSPTLLLSKLGNYSFAEEWSVLNTTNARSVRVNVYNPLTFAAHPMHMHGFNMYILHEGPGEWDGTTIINPNNPQRRDVIQVRAGGHVVIQFDAWDNPGVWPFHCHIAWHVSQGFMVQFLTNPEGVKRRRIPNVVAETCRQWGDWTHTNIPEQIDSGL